MLPCERYGLVSLILITLLVTVPLLLFHLAYGSSMYRGYMLLICGAHLALLHNHRFYGVHATRPTHPLEKLHRTHLRIFLPRSSLDHIFKEFVI